MRRHLRLDEKEQRLGEVKGVVEPDTVVQAGNDTQPALYAKDLWNGAEDYEAATAVSRVAFAGGLCGALTRSRTPGPPAVLLARQQWRTGYVSKTPARGRAAAVSLRRTCVARRLWQAMVSDGPPLFPAHLTSARWGSPRGRGSGCADERPGQAAVRPLGG